MEDKVALALLMGLSNALTRLLPVRLLSGRELSPLVKTWLKYVPVPVLCAMLAGDLLVKDGQLQLAASNLYLWAAIPSFLVAYKTRSLFATVVVGVVSLAALRAF
ncbi:AzlD domain-containing protein [bacterium]|nr:AzlD domain-containing protein [bacterium]